MPINIYHNQNDELLESLCEDEWELPKQILALEAWLANNGKKLEVGYYVADIGFSVRKDASGGGAIITNGLMKQMVSIGMELFLSEYPNEEG